MNIEILGRQAIERIKSEWGLPRRGFIAGGSLANIIWELASGNKAVINDIDVFLLDQIVYDLDKEQDSLFNYEEKYLKYYEDYGGLNYRSVTKDFYTISEVERDGIFNNIKYKSSVLEPSFVLKSFDLNCTKVGYSIQEDKLYWTSDFEEFINTGELKISNIMTPAHTAIRMTKKSKELNVELKEFEINLIEYILNRNFADLIKLRFKKRYYDMYLSNKEILDKYFIVNRDDELENYLSLKGIDSGELYNLKTIRFGYKPIESDIDVLRLHKVFDDINLDYIIHSRDFLFYMRNIYDNEELKQLWGKLFHLWSDNENYIDIDDISNDDLELLSRFAYHAPSSINNLKGMKISEQLKVIKMFLDKFKDDPLIAISILENIKVDKDIELDDDTSLILELSVRKQIINDTHGKVNKILGENKENIDQTINF